MSRCIILIPMLLMDFSNLNLQYRKVVNSNS